MDTRLEQARAFFTEGLAHYEAGDFAVAERAFASALSLAPGRPSVLTNLGATLLKLGRPADALPLLAEALAQEPDNAEALGHCGSALAEQGDLIRALECFDHSVQSDPSAGAVWMLRGNVLRELGRAKEAAESFRTALRNGANESLTLYYLAAVAHEAPPAAPPQGYVETLFDQYADSFDRHVTEALHYRAPQWLGEAVAAGGRRFAEALDLGCGTGLCGGYLRQAADRVTGVDISSRMLERAAATHAYDELVHADISAFLRDAQGPYDVVVAADVFIYVGALDSVFAQLARVIPSGGVFAFTVEESTTGDLELRESLRYAHSEAQVRRLAEAHGFELDRIHRATIREDQRVAVPGLFVLLRRRG